MQEASPDSGTTTYVRNALGDATQMTDGRGIVTNYTYDNAGRMLTRTFPAATAENITYAWDSITSGNKGKGRITSVADQSGPDYGDRITAAMHLTMEAWRWPYSLARLDAPQCTDGNHELHSSLNQRSRN